MTPMTRLTRINIICTKCNNVFSTIVSVSICTWMDPELTEKFLNYGISRNCPNCNENHKIKGKILINARNGMEQIENDADYETKLQKLIQLGAVDKEGNAFPMFGLSKPKKDPTNTGLHPPR